MCCTIKEEDLITSDLWFSQLKKLYLVIFSSVTCRSLMRLLLKVGVSKRKNEWAWRFQLISVPSYVLYANSHRCLFGIYTDTYDLLDYPEAKRLQTFPPPQMAKKIVWIQKGVCFFKEVTIFCTLNYIFITVLSLYNNYLCFLWIIWWCINIMFKAPPPQLQTCQYLTDFKIFYFNIRIRITQYATRKQITMAEYQWFL